MDDLDRQILTTLWGRGRVTWADLGEAIGLSAPAAAERVRRLESRGLIRGYTALVDASQLGLQLTAFVAVTLERPEHRKPFLELVSALPEVQECHHVAGDYDYLLKLRCCDTIDLDRVISDSLKSLPGLLRTRTTIVLSTPKEVPALPLPAQADSA